jgi:hypothetical protein|tara:strand:+ start:290 stop:1012 length:723 start_codon:yes stop_codon:yes gene_type:complete
MALIKNSNPKGNIEDSGYYRLTGDKILALLLQKSQSTVITNGIELEHYIESYCTYKVYKTEYTNISPKTGNLVKTRFKLEGTTPTIDTILEKYNDGENCFFPKIKISKEELKKYGIELTSKNKIELDGVWIVDGIIYIIEMKDGSDFDTKKSDGEIKTFKLVKRLFKGYDFQINIVLWNLKDITNNSVKSLEAKKYITNGKTFSETVGLDFDKINIERKKDQEENKKWILETIKNYKSSM